MRLSRCFMFLVILVISSFIFIGIASAETTIKTSVEFGKIYQDTVTGLSGVAVGITKFQHGCIRIGIQPLMRVDGTIPDIAWLDELRLEGITAIDHALGGPQPDPKEMQSPRY